MLLKDMKKEDREVFVEHSKAIERENTLINNRLTWMIAFHAFLFSAVGFSLEKDKLLIMLIAIV